VRDEWQPIITAGPLANLVRFRFARGDSGMYVQIGRQRLSRCSVFTPNATALHGRDSDLTALDEVWAHTAERGADIDAGIRPARWSRPDGQILWVSAGGTPSSGYLHRLMDRGRSGAPGMAYFEWSADPDAPGYDPYSEDLWRAVHPGIGRTVSVDQIRADATAMTRAEFERAMLCVWPRDVATGLLAGWDTLVDPECDPLTATGPGVLAFDVNPERTAAAVAVAVGGQCEVVDHRPGTRWVPERLAELVDRHRVALVVRDARGPAGATTLPDTLALPVVDATGAQVAQACAWLTDAIADPDPGWPVTLRPNPALSIACAGARPGPRGDGQVVWLRRAADADLSPLYAVTLAGWAAATQPVGAIY